MMKRIWQLGGIGIFVGFFLGGLFYVMEAQTGYQVYTLLLNIQYFPSLSNVQLHGWIEFILHMLVSVLLVILLYYLFKHFQLEKHIYPYVIAHLIIGWGHYLFMALSPATVGMLGLQLWIYWTIGHLLHGILVGVLIRYILREGEYA